MKNANKLFVAVTLFYILISLYFVNGTSIQQYFNDYSPIPNPIDLDIYPNLFTYAHLIDISYCISKIGHISKPFDCALDCSKKFPNMTLVYQWHFDDSVCGYISTTYRNAFYTNNTDERPRKTVIVSLRGTRSIFDTYTDLKANTVRYTNAGRKLPLCGDGCKVHKGFYDYFHSTLKKIHAVLERELDTDNYELIILGHSMGGSIGMLLALHYLDLGFLNLTLVTMGQPLLGNKDFVNWADRCMGSLFKPLHNSFKRKFFRIVHKNDVVATIPRTSKLLDDYAQFNNQIYLNCSSSSTVPSPEQVVDCIYADNLHCIKGDFSGLVTERNYYQNHNTYFRKLGQCGIKI